MDRCLLTDTNRYELVPTRTLGRQSMCLCSTVEDCAVFELPNATTVIFPGDVARVTEHGHLVVSIHLPQGEAE